MRIEQALAEIDILSGTGKTFTVGFLQSTRKDKGKYIERTYIKSAFDTVRKHHRKMMWQKNYKYRRSIRLIEITNYTVSEIKADLILKFNNEWITH